MSFDVDRSVTSDTQTDRQTDRQTHEHRFGEGFYTIAPKGAIMYEILIFVSRKFTYVINTDDWTMLQTAAGEGVSCGPHEPRSCPIHRAAPGETIDQKTAHV